MRIDGYGLDPRSAREGVFDQPSARRAAQALDEELRLGDALGHTYEARLEGGVVVRTREEGEGGVPRGGER